jgi:hypothetical protein
MATPEGDGIVCIRAKRNNPSFLRGVSNYYITLPDAYAL